MSRVWSPSVTELLAAVREDRPIGPRIMLSSPKLDPDEISAANLGQLMASLDGLTELIVDAVGLNVRTHRHPPTPTPTPHFTPHAAFGHRMVTLAPARPPAVERRCPCIPPPRPSTGLMSSHP